MNLQKEFFIADDKILLNALYVDLAKFDSMNTVYFYAPYPFNGHLVTLLKSHLAP